MQTLPRAFPGLTVECPETNADPHPAALPGRDLLCPVAETTADAHNGQGLVSSPRPPRHVGHEAGSPKSKQGEANGPRRRRLRSFIKYMQILNLQHRSSKPASERKF